MSDAGRDGPVDGKILLITGASSGLGAALADQAARMGLRLALTARRADRLAAVAAQARALGAPEVFTIAADLADPESPERIVAEVSERLGGLDVLINNAGFGLPSAYAWADAEALRRQIEVNFTAPVLLTHAALPLLLRRRGMVINVGSAITSLAAPALGAYGPTKAALAYWNDALRRELRHRGLRVCLVEPGPIATEFFEAVAARKPGAADAPPAPRTSALRNFLDAFHPSHDIMTEPPPRLLTVDAEVVARRVLRLLDHPRRRVSVPRSFVWPYRALGSLVRAVPWLGDLMLDPLARRAEAAARTGGLDGGPPADYPIAGPATAGPAPDRVAQSVEQRTSSAKNRSLAREE